MHFDTECWSCAIGERHFRHDKIIRKARVSVRGVLSED